MERVDVLIVGGGAVGIAAARSLASRGRSVLVLERFEVGNANGSSGGATRNVRLTYHDPIYVRMARASMERWHELSDLAGVELLRVVGGLDVGEVTNVSAQALEAAGEPFERPTAAEVADRWPMLRFPEVTTFLFQADGAIVRADEALRLQARLATEHGALIRERTTVEKITRRDDEVEIVTADGEVARAPAAILAAGAWAGSLLRSVGIDLSLTPTLEQSTYFDLGGEGPPLPTVIDWDAAKEPPYIVPNPFAPGEFKSGAHQSGPVVDPDARSFDTDVDRERRVVAWVGEHLTAAPEPVRTDTCLYTTTPDDDFVLDRVGPLVIASPCSGHGFKFTPLIGEALADLATGGTPPFPMDRFRADRPALRV
jgi:sarcosine oxidase